MLKPKKKIFRKEIKTDPFLETMDRAEAHFEKNRANYMKIGLAFIACFLLFKFYFNNKSSLKHLSNTSMGKALISLNQGDVENAKFQFETLVSEYEGLEAAQIARFYLGKIAYEAGDKDNAEDHLKQYLKKKPVDLLVSPAAMILANIALESNKYERAIAYIDKGITATKDEHQKRLFHLEKAKISFQYGNINEARTIVDDIRNYSDLNSSEKQILEELLGALSG